MSSALYLNAALCWLYGLLIAEIRDFITECLTAIRDLVQLILSFSSTVFHHRKTKSLFKIFSIYLRSDVLNEQLRVLGPSQNTFSPIWICCKIINRQFMTSDVTRYVYQASCDLEYLAASHEYGGTTLAF